MKFVLSLLALLSFQSALAADVPELYCVSTKTFENVNQINLFTNKHGTLRMSLQYYAVSEDGQEAGTFDTGILQTVLRLKYDEQTGVFANGANKIKLVVDKKSLTPDEAQKVLDASGAYYDILNPSGHRVDFSKYYLATVTDYNLTAKKGSWAELLKKAHKAGVKTYVCGNRVDMTGPRKTVLDALFDN